jgi:hypothetical protein
MEVTLKAKQRNGCDALSCKILAADVLGLHWLSYYIDIFG